MSMRIALEEHFVIDDPAHVERWRGQVPFIPEGKLAKIKQTLSNLGEQRIAAMAEAGVDLPGMLSAF
jgi:hypothetical protein